MFYPQKRIKSTYSNYLSEYSFDDESDWSYRRGADYWIALNALAKCDSLIAGECFGTFVALKLNNDSYKNVYIFNLGKYGVDKN